MERKVGTVSRGIRCPIIREGDELLVTRGGALGIQNQPERYFAGNPQKYYDPMGGALTGLVHMEVGLLLQEIVR